MYAGAGPNAGAFAQMLSDWGAAHPGATDRFGGGPGDVGFGPGVMPDWFQGAPVQQQSVNAVAGNPNLLHGWQSSPIPQWQIDGEYPGGPGWHAGLPVPPGWQSQPNQAGQGPEFLGPPAHPGGGGPNFLGPPVHPGNGGLEFKGPPIFENWAKHLHELLSNYVQSKNADPSYKSRQQMGQFSPVSPGPSGSNAVTDLGATLGPPLDRTFNEAPSPTRRIRPNTPQ